MKIKIILLALLLVSSIGLYAQSAGYLDSTFNKTSSTPGMKQLDSLQGTMGAVTVDGNGRVITVTYNLKTIHVRRLKADGTNDASFGNQGYRKIVMTDTMTVLCAATQANGYILIGGQRANAAKDMFLVRLNVNGVLDNSFDGDGYWFYDFGGVDKLDRIFVQKDNKIVIGGKRTTGIAVARLNPDASFDTGFGTGGFIGTGNSIQSVGGLEIDDNNKIYIAGDSVGYYYTILKLLPNGAYDNSFGSAGIARITGGGFGTPAGLGVQSDGKVLVGGPLGSPYSFSVARIKANGKIDSSYATNGTGSYSAYYSPVKSMYLDKNEEMVMHGSYSSYNYRLMKISNKGTLDSSFGANGLVIINKTPNTSLSALSPDNKYIVFGQEGTIFFAYKVDSKPVLHIVGSAFVSPNSVEKYSVEIPSVWTSGVTYQWAYTDASNAQFLAPTGISSSSVSVFYNDSIKAGKLTCTVTVAGVIVGIAKLDMEINTEANNASQLAQLQCKKKLTDCSGSYIDYFSLKNISNNFSGCKNGYSDFTQASFVDTFIVGSVYSAIVRVEGSETNKYVGIWIDYNNDGKFNTTDEFVADQSSDVSVIEVNNIVFKNAEKYDGPKRLRIRCRADSAFNAYEACQQIGDLGETEDYLIILTAQKQLEAPEIITPNDDGKNDYFVVRGVNPASGNKLFIFDRWGQEKFSADNYKNNWSGTSKNGEKLTPGTYYYLFTNDNESVRGFLEIRY